MKRALFTFLLLITLFNIQGQTNSNVSAVLKAQAEKMGRLLIDNNFQEFIKYTHPKVTEMMGGDQKMIATLQNGFKDLDKQGIKFLSVKIGEASEIINVNNELQAVVPQKIEIKMGEKVIVSESSLIAFSFNSGKDWKFVDANGKTNKEAKNHLSNIKRKIDYTCKERV